MKRSKRFIGYYKLFFQYESEWEYYKRYADGSYWYWLNWDEQGHGAWCHGGSWIYDRGRHKESIRVSKLEMVLVNGVESVSGK